MVVLFTMIVRHRHPQSCNRSLLQRLTCSMWREGGATAVCRQSRHLSSRRTFSSSEITAQHPHPSLVDSRNSPSDFHPNNAVVYNNVLSIDEGDLLSQDILKRLKRRRYERGHWDAVITNYKEVELIDEMFDDPQIPTILKRIRQHLHFHHLGDGNNINWLPCHAIDLKKDGELNAHVDSIKFSGDLVAGISLLSPCIMRLVPDKDGKPNMDEGWVDLYLPPLSLYALTDVARYRYSHQLLPDKSTFTGDDDATNIIVERDHRLSIIFRDAKRNVE